MDGGSAGRKSDGAKKAAGFFDGFAPAASRPRDVAEIASASSSGCVSDISPFLL